VAVAVTDHAHDTRDIWVYDAKTGDRTQFTSQSTDENWMIWSGHGSRVILNSFAMDHLDLFEAPSTSIDPHTTSTE
jgi:Tol biopolymer transport system component